MSSPKPDRIAALEARKAKIEAQLAQDKARQLHQDKKRIDRLKVLLGAFLLDHLTRNAALRRYVRRHLLESQSRQRDRDFLTTFLDGLPEDE